MSGERTKNSRLVSNKPAAKIIIDIPNQEPETIRIKAEGSLNDIEGFLDRILKVGRAFANVVEQERD